MSARPLKILFAVHDWGLGHATRDLVLIRALVAAGHAVTVLSHGRALHLLREELGASCRFVTLRDIPKPISRRAWSFHAKMALAMPLIFRTFRREREFVTRLWEEERFDRIVSDSRYGVCLPQVPSYYLTHSLRQIVPGRSRLLERFVESAQRALLAGGRKILIPDELDCGGLAGDLAHDVACDWGSDRLAYIGILSSLRRQDVVQDIDCFISISGPEPQRTIFERLVLAQVHELAGRVVVALGRPDAREEVRDDGRIAIHSYMGRQRQEEMMNRARLIVSRSGYTTLMELAELGKRALLVPTVGQTEQEYLARYHEQRGHLHAVAQHKLRLAQDVATARAYRGLPPLRPTLHSVDRFLQVVLG